MAENTCDGECKCSCKIKGDKCVCTVECCGKTCTCECTPETEE